MVVPSPTGLGLRALSKTARRIGNQLGITPTLEAEEMLTRYKGRKLKRYADALDAVNRSGVSKKDASIKMFVKPERFDPLAKRDPDPRAIQFRAAKYCVQLSRFLHPIEQLIYLFDRASCGVPRSRNVAKGLNASARAHLLMRKFENFNDPTAVSLDASRFDAHVSKELLELEHAVYLRCNNDPLFRQLLSWQLHSKGFSNLGLVYKVRGRRMSGDMNTAVGNCLLMLMMLITFFRNEKFLKWDCLDDGDDVVVIVEREDLSRLLDRCKQEFLQFGMTMKIEHVAHDPMKVVFCRSCIVEYAVGRYKFVRDYRDVMSKALCGIRHWEDSKYRARVLKAVGTCELVLNLGVPVLQSYALAILRNVGLTEAVDLAYAPEGLRLRTLRDLRAIGVEASDLKATPILPCARDSFARAFGVDEHEQVRLERRCSEWEFSTAEVLFHGEEVFAPQWIVNQFTGELYRQ